MFGRALKPGQHTIEFDFKYDGPGPGKGGTGVLSVDGKELAKKTIKHTIPLMMSIDETFDVGLDTRTGVDHSYELPFKFTGRSTSSPSNSGLHSSPKLKNRLLRKLLQQLMTRRAERTTRTAKEQRRFDEEPGASTWRSIDRTEKLRDVAQFPLPRVIEMLSAGCSGSELPAPLKCL